MEEVQPLEQPISQSFAPLQIWEKGKVEVTQTKYIERLTFGKLMNDIAKSFNFEKGLLSTMLGLTIRPAETIRSYLDEGRYKVTSPVKYFLLIFGLTIFIGSMTDYYVLDVDQFAGELNGLEVNDTVVEDEEGKPTGTKTVSIRPLENLELLAFVNDSAIKHRNLFGLLNILFYTMFSFLLFRSSKFNFVEHLTINTYIYTHTSIWFLFLVIIGSNNVGLLSLQTLLFLVMMGAVYCKMFKDSTLMVLLKILGVFLLTGILSGVITFAGMFLYLQQSGLLDEMLSQLN